MSASPDHLRSDWSGRQYATALVCVLVLATLLRFTGIGRWSFASDELGTFHEVNSFIQPSQSSSTDPDANVPKMIPVAMFIHHWGHRLFGRDEPGSRTMMALCGLLQIALLGIGLPSMIGRFNTFITCTLMAIAPEHLFYCQYHRFYAPAVLFVTSALLAGWQAHRRNSVVWLIVAIVGTWLAVLTQTLTGSVVGALILGLFVARSALFARTDLRLTLLAVANAIFVAVVAVLYLYPLGKGKAVGYAWVGATIPQAVLSGIAQISFPVALLMLPGLPFLWARNRSACRYLLAFGLIWAATMVVLPKLIPFHSAYLFPLSVPCFVFAGVALGETVTGVHQRHRCAAVMLCSGLLALNLPSLISYYQDGSRHDFRAASELVVNTVGANDHVVFVQGDKFEYYQPTLKGRWERLPPRDFERWADERKPKDGKLWIVIPGGRGGVSSPWKEWLEKRGRLRATVVHRRFDYHEYPIHFFTLEPQD